MDSLARTIRQLSRIIKVLRRARLVTLVAVAALAPPAVEARAQSGADAAAPPPVSAAPARANVRRGAVAAVDEKAGTFAITAQGGERLDYRLVRSTQCVKQKRPVGASAFAPGEAVVVRFRRAREGAPALYDIADPASWTWLDRVRRRTTQVTVTAAPEGFLDVTEGADAAPLRYRVTAKTLWGKSGAAADAWRPKAGDSLWVAPRLLPGGGVMALAVADARPLADRLLERTRPSVTGTVAAFDTAARSLRLRTVAGDDRELRLAETCQARQASKDVPLSAVRVGGRVTAHLKLDAEGVRQVVRLTVQTSSRAPAGSAGAGKGAGAPPPAKDPGAGTSETGRDRRPSIT